MSPAASTSAPLQLRVAGLGEPGRIARGAAGADRRQLPDHSTVAFALTPTNDASGASGRSAIER